MNFYKTSKWKRKREVILRRDNYQCRECKRYGKVTQANTVHHIYPLEDYPEYRLNSLNLVSVCTNCHNTFHDRLTNEITDKGKQWQERIADKIHDNRVINITVDASQIKDLNEVIEQIKNKQK